VLKKVPPPDIVREEMAFKPLPRTHAKPLIPPIKCQGIKTKLVRFILENVQWQGCGRWIEPFLGSGVVMFSVQPKRAIANDINPHLIAFYQKLYDGSLTAGMVNEHLRHEGSLLLKKRRRPLLRNKSALQREVRSAGFYFSE